MKSIWFYITAPIMSLIITFRATEEIEINY